MPKTREKAIEDYLLRCCRAHGLLCLKFVSPARGGVPDRVVVAPRATVFVEVKRPGLLPDRRQRVMHSKMRDYGAEIHIVNDQSSVDALIAHLRSGRMRRTGARP